MAIHHGLAHSLHGFLVLRVGYVIGKTAVGLQKLAALGVSTQVAQNLFKESAVAVAGIYHDVHALERLCSGRCTHTLTYIILQMAGIAGHEVSGFITAHSLSLMVSALLGNVQQGGYVALVKSALRREELQSVAVKRQMTGRNHHTGCHIQLLVYRRHKHGGRRSQPAAHHSSPSLACSVGKSQAERGPGETAVSAYGDAQLTLGALPAEPLHKAETQYAGHLIGEIHLFARHAFECHAPDVGAVLQFFPIHCHHHYIVEVIGFT